MAERVDLEQIKITSFNVLSFMFLFGVKTEFYTRFYTYCFFERQKIAKSGDGLSA